MTKSPDDERFNETLRRMLKTPPKPHKDEPPRRRASKPKRAKPKKAE